MFDQHLCLLEHNVPLTIAKLHADVDRILEQLRGVSVRANATSEATVHVSNYPWTVLLVSHLFDATRQSGPTLQHRVDMWTAISGEEQPTSPHCCSTVALGRGESQFT
jgi:hypothetical protein